MTEAARGHLAMLTFSALVAGSFSLGSMAAPHIAPEVLNTLRFALAGTVLGTLIALRGGIPPAAWHAPWRYFVLAGLFATLTAALAGAMAAHDRFLASWIASPPQTNEIRRSAALIAGAAVAASRFALPVVLSELGASGGLNLWWDRYALALPGRTDGPDRPVVVLAPDWHGPLPPSTRPHVAQRRGVDLMPLDPGDPADALRLAAFLWPDQPQRLEMTRRAAALGSPGIDRADALDWLERRLHSAPQGHLHLVQNTVVWQYLPAPAQARGAAMMAAAGARATAARPLAWLQMESDGNAHGAGGAALTLRLWPGDVTLSLGRADFHGRWIDWTADLSQT